MGCIRWLLGPREPCVHTYPNRDPKTVLAATAAFPDKRRKPSNSGPLDSATWGVVSTRVLHRSERNNSAPDMDGAGRRGTFRSGCPNDGGTSFAQLLGNSCPNPTGGTRNNGNSAFQRVSTCSKTEPMRSWGVLKLRVAMLVVLPSYFICYVHLPFLSLWCYLSESWLLNDSSHSLELHDVRIPAQQPSKFAPQLHGSANVRTFDGSIWAEICLDSSAVTPQNTYKGLCPGVKTVIKKFALQSPSIPGVGENSATEQRVQTHHMTWPYSILAG